MIGRRNRHRVRGQDRGGIDNGPDGELVILVIGQAGYGGAWGAVRQTADGRRLIAGGAAAVGDAPGGGGGQSGVYLPIELGGGVAGVAGEEEGGNQLHSADVRRSVAAGVAQNIIAG